MGAGSLPPRPRNPSARAALLLLLLLLGETSAPIACGVHARLRLGGGPASRRGDVDHRLRADPAHLHGDVERRASLTREHATQRRHVSVVAAMADLHVAYTDLLGIGRIERQPAEVG